ncbi:MAG: hypothetical protein U5N26_11210 [Candidatus Marinimicrobia bacterium]|nr:hypothetical protein [Candidatus Neomarinimicrobiota bacterium]
MKMSSAVRTDWGGFAKDRSKNFTNILKADYENQFNENNEFKTGMKFVYTQYEDRFLERSPDQHVLELLQ